jgi:hypothetical protein
MPGRRPVVRDRLKDTELGRCRGTPASRRAIRDQHCPAVPAGSGHRWTGGLRRAPRCPGLPINSRRSPVTALFASEGNPGFEARATLALCGGPFEDQPGDVLLQGGVISLETYSSKVVSGMRRDPSMRKRAANLRTVRPAPSGHEAEPGWIPVPADDYRVTAVNTGLGWML